MSRFLNWLPVVPLTIYIRNNELVTQHYTFIKCKHYALLLFSVFFTVG
jgi:hypothetical protein